ncbi:uncharacterized protein K02A2.6-like [Bicyclus anynana]|uniref:RNA-directed DNA polymerase n=1 Tax=Bicyclus anynana TaxID=110368 RepID=A0ABM3LZK5_BICAN|nr:uncharacterized protein K02A2.6-like [Bicyclus anynana]
MSHIPSLETFDCDGDPASVGLRWEKWKRGLEIFLIASDISDPKKRKANLLHLGGLALQEIYYNLPGDQNTDADEYDFAIKKLDTFFSPMQSKIYERHLFRLLKQEPNEKFDKFLVRLRHQSSKCKFSNNEDNIIDQIVEKCNSKDLRKKILTLGDDATLDKIIAQANAIEAVERQLDDFGQASNTSGVYKIDTKYIKSENSECFRCGSVRHSADSNICPARNKQCLKCGFLGHFRNKCRTRASKRNSSILKATDNYPRKKMKIASDDQKKSETNQKPYTTSHIKTDVNYIFHIDDDALMSCNVGGVQIDMIIDSGSKHNILSDKTWSYLKKYKVAVRNQIAKPDKTFIAYGSDKPLIVTGSFDTDIQVADQVQTATFYVVKDGTRDLLGKDTAISLKVLKLGLEINAVSETSFPKIKNVELNISINKLLKPVAQPCRRVPIPLEEKINKKIEYLIKLDIIEPVKVPSGWVSPIVPVLKPNGEIRVCIDMRHANKAIVRENYPLPTMDQLLPKFKKAKLFSKLDIKDAFHQVELSEDSRDITTFITSKGLYRYKRLMFGISCAPEQFQKILERILLPCEGVVNFIDDIVVYGENKAEHNARLEKLLATLKESNILLNQNKCVFCVKSIKFLGHELSIEGVKPLDKYVKVVKQFRNPTTVEEVQSFLGLVNYVNKWIPNLATKSEPLRRLLTLKLGKNAHIGSYWGPEQTDSFKELKDSLSNIHTLGYYDLNDKTTVMADASPVGLGAVLIQSDSNGPRIIAYGNKSLTDVEKRYCQTEKEALALVWAVEHFDIYLFGKDTFDLVTDHKPLEVIFGSRLKTCARIERWVLRLQAYNFKVLYKPGKTNIADCLSRLCATNNPQPFEDENHIDQIVQLARPCALEMKTLTELSLDDNEIRLVNEALSSNNWDPLINIYRIFQTELWTYEGLLLRGTKIVIPLKLRHQVLEAAHEGHPGIGAMKARLRTKVWWPKIDSDAEKFVKSCKGCTLVSAPNPPIPMKRRELPSKPWIDVAIDFLGPLPSGHHLFVIVDYYSRYKEIKLMKTITSAETIKVLREIFSRLGSPFSITADNAKSFSSDEFKNFCKILGINIFYTTPYSPQQNGEVERQNRDILKRLKISQSEKSNWYEDLLLYLTMYNSTPHSTTGKTPSELFFGRQFRDKLLPSLIDLENTSISEIKDKDKIMKEKGKEYGDRRRKAQDIDIGFGEKVYVKNMVKENKLTTNFNPTTHTVLNHKGPEYNIRNDETGQELRRNIIHLKRIEGQWGVVGGDEDDSDKISDLNSD